MITEDLVNAVDEKIREDRRFTISTLALEFPNVSRTILLKIVSENLPQMMRLKKQLSTGYPHRQRTSMTSAYKSL